MTGRRAIFGLCLLCALAFSALAAQSAGAVTKGTTGFTCVKGTGSLRGEHCLTSGNAAAEFGHVEVTENTRTEVAGSNSKTSSETTAASPLILKMTIAGAVVELKATGLEGAGWTENRKAATGEHYIQDEGSTSFTGVTVTKPEAAGCKVFRDNAGLEGTEGVIETNPLKVTTEGQGDFFKFEPASGSTFATFWITCEKGKVPEACEGTWTVTGSMKAPANGATVAFSHEEITTQNTLKAKGVKAGLGGSVTVSSRLNSTESFKPLTVTTVETP